MTPQPSSSIRLFRLAGIQVLLHWSWFLVAFYEISTRRSLYSSVGWNVAEYIALFMIVLTHEFGHALACRQVGGASDTIVLWPLGGVAYISAPQRAGAQLWSIAAGPLVNVVLVIVFYALSRLEVFNLWLQPHEDLLRFFVSMVQINFWLLIFNLLPIFPLDGGQILRSLLWFVIGRARSLFVATAIGMVGLAGLAAYIVFQLATAIGVVGLAGLTEDPVFKRSIWTGAVTVFLFQMCWRGMQQAKALRKIERLPRHSTFTCPVCHSAPPAIPVYSCPQCHGAFDPFATNATCPHCANRIESIPCVHCGANPTPGEWGMHEGV